MSQGNGSTICNCMYCGKRVDTKRKAVDVFWFTGSIDKRFTVHQERDAHVVVQFGNRVVAVKEQPAFARDRFLGLAHRNCTRGVPTLSFPFNPFDHMTRNDIAICMKKAVTNAIRGIRQKKTVKRVKSGRIAAA